MDIHKDLCLLRKMEKRLLESYILESQSIQNKKGGKKTVTEGRMNRT